MNHYYKVFLYWNNEIAPCSLLILKTKRRLSRTILEENHKNGSGGLRLVTNYYLSENI